MIRLDLHQPDRICRDCDGTGLVNLGPYEHGGVDVQERCDCQPVQVESDQDYYARKQAEANAYLDAHPPVVPKTETVNEWLNDSRRERYNDED